MRFSVQMARSPDALAINTSIALSSSKWPPPSSGHLTTSITSWSKPAPASANRSPISLPAIDFAVRNKKRVVISTHTISLQEQLIDKDIPLLRSVYPDEFTAVLVKGRSNYLCQRRLEQTRGRQNFLFDDDRQLESLWMIEDWAARTTDGSLADLPTIPNPSVWERICAEQGNCLGKKCRYYENCFWQAAKRRMQSGNVLVVNHALFFSDLALRSVGVNYLPKYDLVVLDEAHTVEDVAGSHFGLKISEGAIRYQLRTLYDPKRGKGLLSTHGSGANDAIGDVVELHGRMERFFERVIHWHEHVGRSNGRVHESNIVENDLTPKLRDLAKHLKAMMAGLENEEEVSEIGALSEKVNGMAVTLEAIMSQSLADSVYWVDVSGANPQARQPPRRPRQHRRRPAQRPFRQGPQRHPHQRHPLHRKGHNPPGGSAQQASSVSWRGRLALAFERSDRTPRARRRQDSRRTFPSTLDTVSRDLRGHLSPARLDAGCEAGGMESGPRPAQGVRRREGTGR